jgi:hypothetical protein
MDFYKIERKDIFTHYNNGSIVGCKEMIRVISLMLKNPCEE